MPLVGGVVYDAILFYREAASRGIRPLSRIGLRPGEYVLATIHRAENTSDEDSLASIIDAAATGAASRFRQKHIPTP